VVTVPGCATRAGGPPGLEPLPDPAQIAYQRSELTVYVHLGLGTFDGTEYGDPSVDTPSLFNPTLLDANQWATAFADAGFRQVTLVVKHSTGFCLWPSAYTDYSVASSEWRGGQGDVVRDFAEAMRAHGLRVGLHLSAWDEHFPSSSPAYEAYLHDQVTELLTQYGPIDEIGWIGYQAPTSIDGGALVQLAKALQPEVLVWMGPELAAAGADLRYLGNQHAEATRVTSSIGDVPNGGPTNVWYPAQAPASDRGESWFWHPEDEVISLDALQETYFRSVGMNATLLLNVPPNASGLIDTPDLELLAGFGAWVSALYAEDRLRGQPAAADSAWSQPGFDAARAVDDDVCTCWAAAEGATTARLEVTPLAPVSIQLISIREPIELGERTTAYHVELKQDGAWNPAPTDGEGARIQGTVIGQRQLWRLDPTTIEGIALVIDSARAAPAIAEFAAY